MPGCFPGPVIFVIAAVQGAAMGGGLNLAESDCSRQLLGRPNQIEAVMSTFERRDPDFIDPWSLISTIPGA